MHLHNIAVIQDSTKTFHVNKLFLGIHSENSKMIVITPHTFSTVFTVTKTYSILSCNRELTGSSR